MKVAEVSFRATLWRLGEVPEKVSLIFILKKEPKKRPWKLQIGQSNFR